MVVKKRTRKKAASPSRPENWREALVQHLSKVPEIDALFIRTENSVVHVYSIVFEFAENYYKRLMTKERAIERAFPELSFEFHTRAHQGREPHYAAPFDAEQVFVR